MQDLNICALTFKYDLTQWAFAGFGKMINFK